MSWYPAQWLLIGHTSPILQRQTDTIRELVKTHRKSALEVRRMPVGTLEVRALRVDGYSGRTLGKRYLGFVPVEGGVRKRPGP